MRSATKKTGFILALCLLSACADSREDLNATSETAQARDFSGPWQARAIAVAGENCVEALDLAFTIRDASIQGWVFGRSRKPEDGTFQHDVSGTIDEAGRFDLTVMKSEQEIFAVATGWLGAERPIGLLEGRGAADSCFWRLVLAQV